jgi:hypothetical protein
MTKSRRFCSGQGGYLNSLLAKLLDRGVIQMPESMDGLKLAHAIRNRWPPVEIIVTSGQVRPFGGMSPENVPFLVSLMR